MKKPLRPDTHGRHAGTEPGRRLPTPPRRAAAAGAPGTARGAKALTSVGKPPIAPGSTSIIWVLERAYGCRIALNRGPTTGPWLVPQACAPFPLA